MKQRWVAVVLWAVVIETLTSWPNLPSFGAPAGSDKVAHIALYAMFSFLVARALVAGRPTLRIAAVVVVALAAWGALDELHQRWIPGRSCDFDDWVADASGVVAGLVIRRLWAARPILNQART